MQYNKSQHHTSIQYRNIPRSGHDEIRRLVDAWMTGDKMPKKVVELWRSRGVAVKPDIPGEKELFHKEYLSRNNVYKVKARK